MNAEDREALFAELARMPECLERATAGVDDEALRRRPAGETFSLIENVWHLTDLERDGYAVRIARLRDEVDPLLPDFDGARVARVRWTPFVGQPEGWNKVGWRRGLASWPSQALGSGEEGMSA